VQYLKAKGKEFAIKTSKALEFVDQFVQNIKFINDWNVYIRKI